MEHKTLINLRKRLAAGEFVRPGPEPPNPSYCFGKHLVNTFSGQVDLTFKPEEGEGPELQQRLGQYQAAYDLYQEKLKQHKPELDYTRFLGAARADFALEFTAWRRQRGKDTSDARLDGIWDLVSKLVCFDLLTPEKVLDVLGLVIEDSHLQ